MEEFKVDQLRKLIAEVLTEGFGEVEFKVLVKNSRIELITMIKTTTSKIDLDREKSYS